MTTNFRKLMQEVPRPFEIEERDQNVQRDPSRKKVSGPEAMRRLEPLMGLISSGDIPLDSRAADAVAAYMERHHAQQS